MTEAWAARVGDHTDKLVLLALADAANDEGECYPSLSNLSLKAEVHRRTAIRSVQSLVEQGHVSKEIREGRSTVYCVHPVVTQSHQCQPVTSDSQSPTSALRVTPPPPPITPSPSKNRHQPSTRRTRTAVERDEPPPSNLNVEAWHRWVQYRGEIRRPIKRASILAAQRKLAGFGADQEAVVEQSIADGYQGLFPLKAKSKAANGGWV